MLLLLALQLAAQQPPSPEAMSLGRKLVEQSGVLEALDSLQAEELAELKAEPEASALTNQQREALNAIGERISAQTRERVLLGVATTYAKNLSIEDLKALVAAGNRPEAIRFRALRPRALMMAALMVGPVSFKRQTAAEYCNETKLMCNRTATD